MDSFEMEVASEFVHAHEDGEDVEVIYHAEVTLPCDSIIYGVSVRYLMFWITRRIFRASFHV